MPNKPHTGKFINCLNCTKEFYIPLNRFDKAKFCSRSCQGLHIREKIKQVCKICAIEFEHISSRCNKAKYCSRKCYHKGQHLNGTIINKCAHCEKKFKSSPSQKRKYCSKACVNKVRKEIWNPAFSTIRKSLKVRGKIERCEICNYDKCNDILGIHHKDRNRKNNALENLMILCPNCHSMIHHKHICH